MKQTAFTLLLVLLIVSCKKEEANTPTPQSTAPTATELLTNGSQKDWKLTSTLLNGSSVLQNCEKDNTYTFAANGDKTLDFGMDKCTSTEPQKENRKWKFLNNEKSMEWITPTDTFVLDIDTLTKQQLKVTQNTTFMGNPLQFILTFEVK